MDVRFRSFPLSSIVLNDVTALPTIHPFVLNTLLYLGGDMSALRLRPRDAIIPIVSLHVHLATNLLIPFPGFRIRSCLSSSGWL